MLLDKRKTLVVALLVLVTTRAEGAAQEPAKTPAKRLEVLWVDLASADEGRAMRATLALAANPTESVPFLKERLRAVKVDATAVARLVKQLDSEDFDMREAAARELEYFGKFARPLLNKHLADEASAEAKRAIRGVIEKIPSDEKATPPPKLKGNNVSIRSGGDEVLIYIDGKLLDLTAYGPKPPPPPYMGWMRAARATAVLEHLATPEARQLLEKLADGEADAPPTKAAKESLERLKNKAE